MGDILSQNHRKKSKGANNEWFWAALRGSCPGRKEQVPGLTGKGGDGTSTAANRTRPKPVNAHCFFCGFCEDRQLSVAFWGLLLGAGAAGRLVLCSFGGDLWLLLLWWLLAGLVLFLLRRAGLSPLSLAGRPLRAGCSVSVGCAVGADQLVLSAALAAPGGASRLSVFAVGAASGAGFWSGSALPAVRSAAAAGARVVWLAGGALSLPLRARLALRSHAGLVGASGFVLFLASPSSPGSLSVAVAAVAAGLPVFAFAVGFVGAPLAPRGCPGSSVPSSLAGFACWRWVPVALQPRAFLAGVWTAIGFALK